MYVKIYKFNVLYQRCHFRIFGAKIGIFNDGLAFEFFFFDTSKRNKYIFHEWVYIGAENKTNHNNNAKY